VVEAFALLGDQRKQQSPFAGTQSLQSLSDAVRNEIEVPASAAPAALEVVTREREAS
jgi:hypothetical protein